MKIAGKVGAVLLALAPLAAFATNGYFAHGYGIKSKSMAGVGIALPQDSIVAAMNPAGMVWVGNRMDVGIDWFRPDRDAEIVGNTFGLNGKYDGSGDKNFFIPEFGYNRMLNPDMSVGLSIYGNGGMNTRYEDSSPFATGPFAAFGGRTPAGVDLAQIFIAPSVAYKITPNQSVGVTLNIAYQMFEIYGLQAFANPAFSTSPGNVTNRGYDHSWGAGVRIGWVGQIAPMWTLGATWQSRTYMSKFDKYKGLFADKGDFDIPENYGIGVAFRPNQALTVAFDVQRILYGDVESVGNSISPLLAGVPLGSNNGPGFGWRNLTAYKLGVSYAVNNNLMLRAGYSTNRQPIAARETLFNILAPGVVEDHVTLGATWTFANKSELTVGYMHAFEKKVKGSNSIPPGFGGGNANLRMYEDSLGVAFGWPL